MWRIHPFLQEIGSRWNTVKSIYWFPKHETQQNDPSLGGLEPPTFRLTVERANRLRHRDSGGVRRSLSSIQKLVLSWVFNYDWSDRLINQ